MLNQTPCAMPRENEELYFTLKVYRGTKDGEHKLDDGKNVDNYPFKFDLEFTYPFEPTNDKLSQNRPVLITKNNITSEMESVFAYLRKMFEFIKDIDKQNVSADILPEEVKKYYKGRQDQIDKLKIILNHCDNINRLTYSQFSPGRLDVGANTTLFGNGDMKPPRL